MNRKMRAKLNNKIAKAKRERRPCPLADSVVFTGPDQHNCDKCGSELVPLAAVVLVPEEGGRPPGETLQ